jgi:phosphoheptose isomerase
MPAESPLAARVREYLERSAEVKRAAATACAADIARAAELVVACYARGGKVLFCGNGGSAADCQHLAAELVSSLNHDRPRRALPGLALTTDTSFLTANANDFGFEHVFERQVEALGQAGDVLVGITTSGNSPNVLRALERARAQGLGTILFSGGTGGKARALADVAVLAPSGETQHIQEVHIAAGHVLCALVEEALFPLP